LSLIAGAAVRFLREDAGAGWKVVTAFLALAVYSPALQVPFGLERLRDGLSGGLRETERKFQEDVAFVRSHPGPALCHSPLLCYRAGREFLFDPFNASQALKLGHLDPMPLLRDVTTGAFAVIQLSTNEEAHSLGPSSRGGPDLRREFQNALDSRYRLARRSLRCAFYLPR
jgi:hypothetical protein